MDIVERFSNPTLKIKPPLCLSIESADFFADLLEKVLLQGW
ncbi:hypothetical protein [Rhizobium laguerreae]|nr:hypothetical protein [Rhizobium laguerreae]